MFVRIESSLSAYEYHIFILIVTGVQPIVETICWKPEKSDEFLNILQRLLGAAAALQPSSLKEGSSVQQIKHVQSAIEYIKPYVKERIDAAKDWGEFFADHIPKTDDAAQYVRENPHKIVVPLREVLIVCRCTTVLCK